jgi:hypothetical protein
LGDEFRVDTYTGLPGRQRVPRVASDASGNVIVVWESDHTGLFNVYGQQYDSAGNPLGGNFQVNTYTSGLQGSPAVASDANGNFVVVWESSQYGQRNIMGQRYNSGGNPLSGEFRVSTYTTWWAGPPVVASDANGNFVVVWASRGTEPDDYNDVIAQRYDSNGSPLGGNFRVNTYTTYQQFYPSVTSDATGGFVVVWENRYAYSSWRISGQRYDSGGSPLGGEFQVNPPGDSQHPSVASDATGGFVVVWESDYGFNDEGVFGQRYDSSGNPVGSNFRVNTYTTFQQQAAAVASDASGNFVVVWESWDGWGGKSGVFGQRFSAACEASVQVKGASQDFYTPGSTLPIRIHIAHKRPETVTVPWELSLIAASGWVVAERVTPPHTFEPGDVVDKDLALTLPEHLEEGTYTLRLGIGGMAGIEAATTTFRVVTAASR